MSERYKLVFRGEVLDGQHPAVVRQRLAQAADFDESALDKLFSGRPVVLKREADTATAAQLQGLFKKAGARLRVLPVETATPVAPAAQPAPAAPRATASVRSEPELLPAGSDILRVDERAPWAPREIDTGDLALEGARFLAPEDAPAPPAPDVSHLTLAAVGTDLSPADAPEAHRLQVPDFVLAPPGVDLAPAAAPAARPVDLSAQRFEMAPAGSDLGQRKGPAPPEAPDTSHLMLAD